MTILNFLNQVEQQERSQSQQWHRHYTNVLIKYEYVIKYISYCTMQTCSYISKSMNMEKSKLHKK